VGSLLLDPEIKAVVDQVPVDSDMGLLALDCLFVSFPVEETDGIVCKEEVGGIGDAIGNQIICHFFVKMGPFNVSLLDNTVDLAQWKSILFMQSFCLGTTHLSKELLAWGRLPGCSQF